MIISVLPAGRVALPAVALEVREAEEVARAAKPDSAIMVVAESVAILRVSVVTELATMSLAEIMLAMRDPADTSLRRVNPETEAVEAVREPLILRLPLIRTSPFSAMTRVSPIM